MPTDSDELRFFDEGDEEPLGIDEPDLNDREARLSEKARELAKAKARLEDERKKFKAKRHEAQEVLDRRIRENEERLNGYARRLRRRRKRLQKYLQTLRLRRAHAAEEATQAELIAEAQAGHTVQIQALQEQIEELVAQAEAAENQSRQHLAEITSKHETELQRFKEESENQAVASREALAARDDELSTQAQAHQRVVNELQSRLAALDQERQVVEDRLRGMTDEAAAARQVFERQVKVARQEIDQLHEQSDGLNKQLKALQKGLKDRDVRLAKHERTEQELTAARAAIEKQLRELIEERDGREAQLRQDLAAREAGLQQATDRQRELEAKNRSLDEKLRLLAEASAAESDRLQNELQSQRRKTDEAAAAHVFALAQADRRIERRERLRHKLRAASNGLKQQLAEGQQQWASDTASLRRELEARDEQLARQEERIADLVQQFSEARKRAEQLAEASHRREQEQRQRQRDHELAIEELERECAAREARIEQQAAELRDLLESQAEFQEEVERLKADGQAESERLTALIEERDHQLASRQAELQDAQTATARLAAERQQLESRLLGEAEELRGQIAKLTGEHQQAITRIKAELQARGTELSRLRESEVELTSRAEQVQRELERRAWEEHEVRVGLQEEAVQKERQIAEHRQALRTREEQLQTSIEREQQLRDDIERLRDKLQEFTDRLERAEGELVIRSEAGDAGGHEEAAAPRPLPEPPSQPRLSVVGLIALGLVVVVLAGVLVTAWALRPPKARYLVTGMLAGQPGDSTTLAMCRDVLGDTGKLAGPDGWRVEMRLDAGVLAVMTETDDPRKACTELDAAGSTVVTQVRSRLLRPTTTEPALDGEQNDIAARIEGIDGRLAAETQPAGLSARQVTTVLADLQGLQAERQKLTNALRELTARLAEQEPAEAAVSPPPARLRQAEADSSQLQADLVALKQRQDRLGDLLRELLEPGEQRIGAFQTALVDADALLAEEIKTQGQGRLATPLAAMRESLRELTRATKDFGEIWASRFAEMHAASDETDAVACQIAGETAAKTFLADLRKARQNFQKTLDTIQEGDDEPTKRIVLHRDLNQKLGPLNEALDKVEWQAKTVCLADNVQLAALVNTVTSLQSRVLGHRSRIESVLREEMLSQLREQHSQVMAAARGEREELVRRLAEIDERLDTQVGQAVAAAQGQQVAGEAADRQLTLLKQRAVLSERLHELQAARRSAAREEAAAVLRYIPAQTLALTTGSESSLLWTLTIGLGPVLICLSLVALLWWATWWRRSRQDMESYARQLAETAALIEIVQRGQTDELGLPMADGESASRSDGG